MKGLFVRAVLLGDLRGLVGTLAKCVSDCVGSDSLLPGKSGRDGVLQSVMELSEVRLDRSAISKALLSAVTAVMLTH